MKLRSLFLLLALGLFIASCNDDDPDPMTNSCDTTDLNYTDDISTIINSSCALAGCHVTGGGSFSMQNYDDLVVAIGFNRIEGAINHQTGFLPMPYPAGSDKLDDCTISKITTWISDGFPE